MYVRDSSTLSGATVSAGGALVVSSGAHISRAVISDNGSYLYLVPGAKGWYDTATHGPGRIHVSSGASTFNPLAESGGHLRGEGNFYNGTVKNGGVLYTWPGGYAQGFTVSSGGVLVLSSTASANTVYLDSGGSLTVSSGGTAVNVHSSAGAVVTSMAGAVIKYV